MVDAWLIAARDEIAARMDALPDPTPEDVARLGRAFHALAALIGYPVVAE